MKSATKMETRPHSHFPLEGWVAPRFVPIYRIYFERRVL